MMRKMFLFEKIVARYFISKSAGKKGVQYSRDVFNKMRVNLFKIRNFMSINCDIN